MLVCLTCLDSDSGNSGKSLSSHDKGHICRVSPIIDKSVEFNISSEAYHKFQITVKLKSQTLIIHDFMVTSCKYIESMLNLRGDRVVDMTQIDFDDDIVIRFFENCYRQNTIYSAQLLDMFRLSDFFQSDLHAKAYRQLLIDNIRKVPGEMVSEILSLCKDKYDGLDRDILQALGLKFTD